MDKRQCRLHHLLGVSIECSIQNIHGPLLVREAMTVRYKSIPENLSNVHFQRFC